MPSTATNVAMAGVGAFAAAGALSGAFVAPAGQVQHSEPQMQRTNLRAAGYGSSQATGVGAMAGLGAVAGLAAAGVAGKRASKGRTSLQAVGVGINGFGRIGRQVARIAMKDPETELKLINASYDADYLAYMMKYDTIHGKYDGTVEVDGDSLVIDGQKVALSHTRDPAEIPFGEHGAEYVCESTGVFLTTEKVQPHLKAGAKKVIFSAPAKDDSHTIVMGVNESTYDPSMEAVSCASCTTNGLAPAVRVLQEKFGIKRGLMTTCHAMTASQPTVDGTSKKDWRGGRAGPGNIIPSSTGAAKAVAKVIPDVKGKLTGMALRVPTIDVSVVDLTVELEKETTYEEICAEMKKRSEGDMKGYLGYTDEALVSTDFETNPISCTFDSKAGIMLDPTFVKVVCWYDNEWGYSCRVVDLIKHMAKEVRKPFVAQILVIMPSTATNVAVAGVGAFAAAGAMSGAFVAPAGQVQHSEPQMQRTNLRAAGYGSSQATGVGAMAGLGAVAGLAAAGVAGKRASKGRTSLQAVGVGINGFGRIGRQVARIAMKDPETELKLINASYDADYLAYMMKYDTIHGKYDGTVEVDGDSLVIDGQKVALSHTRDPAEIPFGEHGAEYVCESTGVFLTTEKVQPHLKAGAKKVIFSAPAKDDSHTIVMGVNESTYDPSMEAVSCASCTTNGLAPAVRVLQEKFGIKRGLMTTCHAMTASQPTVDGTSKKDWRGGRAGPGNIIPSSTGAAKAVAKVIPDVKGKLTGMALRVPTIDVSVVDLTVELEKETTYEEICAEMKKRSEGDMKGYLGYTDEALVSTDFETNPISCTFDSKAGIMLDPTFVKVVCWYDNEWGYSCRVVDLIKHMAKEAWGVPGWIGNGTFFSKDNIVYHVSWLKCIKETLDIEIDYVGIWNERAAWYVSDLAAAIKDAVASQVKQDFLSKFEEDEPASQAERGKDIEGFYDDMQSSKHAWATWISWKLGHSTCKAIVGTVLLASLISLTWFQTDLASAEKATQHAPPTVLVDGQQYSAVQYLGINLFTAPGTEADGCFGDRDEMEQCYLGSDKVRDDVERRLQILIDAVERAFASEHWDRSPSTLKIVLLPEFYWRGKQGAYRISPKLEHVAHSTVQFIFNRFSHERFKHWLVIDGTVVMAQTTDERYVRMSGRPGDNITYFNFAPVHVGGTNTTYLKFKRFVSGIDFLKAGPKDSRVIPPPPHSSHEFCRKHPDSNGCTYGRLPEHLLQQLGFGHDIELPNGLLNIGGLKIGLEICLDHAMGQLCNRTLSDGQTVDVQLIISAGMNIASGPVCTAKGGPVFLADGFARTEVSLNSFGDGRHATLTPGHERRFNVGIAYGADVMVAMQQWIADTIYSITGTGFGTRFPGLGTLPGGSFSSGDTGVPFKQMSALGEYWEVELEGFYNTGNYKEAKRTQESLLSALLRLESQESLAMSEDILMPKTYPTIDIYGPFTVPGRG
ncbi:Glyceraldehyde-3-phosphate dehydrogenase, chloroplastic [Symbiodinium microadriaticum]|uniref:Glyceraldehyde-3-phosphate dehydrogenase, chloroplastic n=1 Tax=Symbiodinium microadriaticum TaxID=2951 RepID=A0A1Q9E616_SYMMI|nr:Glyceraldehyde-3-phosphate dehydrogenase, chloroplastic [Symbiodinium microadriaticum]